MRVLLLAASLRAQYGVDADTVVDLPDAEAERWVAAGAAREAPKPKRRKKAKAE